MLRIQANLNNFTHPLTCPINLHATFNFQQHDSLGRWPVPPSIPPPAVVAAKEGGALPAAEGECRERLPLLPEAQHNCSPRRRHRGDDPEPPEASRSQAVLASEERVMDAFATGAIRLGGDQAECGGGYPPPPRRVRSLRPGERRRESCRRSWRLRSASWTRLPRAPRPSARLKTRCNRKEIGCRCTGSRGGGASENN